LGGGFSYISVTVNEVLPSTITDAITPCGDWNDVSSFGPKPNYFRVKSHLQRFHGDLESFVRREEEWFPPPDSHRSVFGTCIKIRKIWVTSGDSVFGSFNLDSAFKHQTMSDCCFQIGFNSFIP